MAVDDTEAEAQEMPAFWIGAAGFSAQQRTIIEASLRPTAGAAWRLSKFGDADAWLINGAKCRMTADGNLRVSPGVATEAAFNLDMRATNRPVAFATPIADANLEPHLTFDANSSADVQRTLAQFDSWLGFARAQFALGAQIVMRGALLRHCLYHVHHQGKLLAILDFWHGDAALSPQMTAEDLEAATWDQHPAGARILPPGFAQFRPAQLAWRYVLRSSEIPLPARYKNRTIYYRRVPRVPLSWLRDSHLRLLKDLSVKCASLSELSQRTGIVSPQIERDLSCLFHAGAITTTESKAASPAAAQAYSRRPILEEQVAHVPERADPTVPGRLGLHE
jgi:hypothetical protein